MAIQEQEKILIYSKKQDQIKALIFNKALTAVRMEYSNYSNVFLAEYVAKFLEYIRINDYAIKLKKSK